MPTPLVLVDNPAPHVRRITLNRPEKRNALNHELRGGILEALQEGDAAEDVRVQIVRGAGKCFSAGYDLGGGNEGQAAPWYTAGGDGHWPRHVTEGWLRIWEFGKPVIAQVHGYCLAGGSELATCCDLVYMACDAQMGYPAVRFGVPDNHFHPWFLGMRKAMEMMLTGDALNGEECARLGWANAAFPAAELEARVLEMARRIAKVPPELAQLNKRVVHRQMEIMGLRTGVRAGSELCALGTHTQALADFMAAAEKHGLKETLQARDSQFADYRAAQKGRKGTADLP